MTENDHMPAGLDGGIDPTPFNGLWFEQVIQQNIRPPIEGLKILQIPLGNGNFAAVITVPQSKTVHQVKDGRYYRRRNFRNDVMEDYEVREAFNRQTKPDLYLRLTVTSTVLSLPTEASGRSTPFHVIVHIGNKSHQPSFYTVVHLFSDTRLEGAAPGFETGAPSETNTGLALNRWIRKLGIPGHFPIFSETEFSLLDSAWPLTIPADLIDAQAEFLLGYGIFAPGFTGQAFGKVLLNNRTITLVMDQPPA